MTCARVPVLVLTCARQQCSSMCRGWKGMLSSLCVRMCVCILCNIPTEDPSLEHVTETQRGMFEFSPTPLLLPQAQWFIVGCCSQDACAGVLAYYSDAVMPAQHGAKQTPTTSSTPATSVATPSVHQVDLQRTLASCNTVVVCCYLVSRSLHTHKHSSANNSSSG